MSQTIAPLSGPLYVTIKPTAGKYQEALGKIIDYV
jgi:hypothetical protein